MTEIHLSWAWVIALIIQGVIQAVAYGITMVLIVGKLTKWIAALSERNGKNKE